MSYSKYYLWKKQVSNDDGVTWHDVIPLETTPSGDPIATYATLEECQGIVPPTPTPQYRWTNSGWTCSGTSGYDKYNLQVKEVSYDSGATWSAVTPTETQLGTLIEADSPDCGYVPPSYSAQYLTFIASDDITVTFTPQNSNILYYSLDSGSTWTQGNTITMDASDEVMLKGTMTSNGGGIGIFSSNGSFEAIGNPMSLLFGDNFSGQTSLRGKGYAFNSLFSGCTYLESIENLVLPATTLATNCYNSMFYGCSSLTTVPSGFLPSTTMALSCYYQMFAYCTSLTTVPSDLLQATTLNQGCYYGMFLNCVLLMTAPDLPATTLSSRCYQYMFYGCGSLTTAPDLLATTLANYCYLEMFFQCTNLNYIKCLATNISANYCTENWLYGVAASGTFVKASSMSGWSTGDSGIPSNWSVQDA